MKLIKNNSILYTLFFLISGALSFYININYRFYQITIELSEFVFWMSVPAFIFSVITLFVREEVARKWRKFSNYFLLASVVIILLTPNSSHGMDIYPLIKENVTIVLATLYSVISLLLILYKSFKNTRE